MKKATTLVFKLRGKEGDIAQVLLEEENGHGLLSFMLPIAIS
jgi:hypothetical protein